MNGFIKKVYFGTPIEIPTKKRTVVTHIDSERDGYKIYLKQGIYSFKNLRDESEPVFHIWKENVRMFLMSDEKRMSGWVLKDVPTSDSDE